jgi:hypothetical protein
MASWFIENFSDSDEDIPSSSWGLDRERIHLYQQRQIEEYNRRVLEEDTLAFVATHPEAGIPWIRRPVRRLENPRTRSPPLRSSPAKNAQSYTTSLGRQSASPNTDPTQTKRTLNSGTGSTLLKRKQTHRNRPVHQTNSIHPNPIFQASDLLESGYLFNPKLPPHPHLKDPHRSLRHQEHLQFLSPHPQPESCPSPQHPQ